jgi:hypothetical protein
MVKLPLPSASSTPPKPERTLVQSEGILIGDRSIDEIRQAVVFYGGNGGFVQGITRSQNGMQSVSWSHWGWRARMPRIAKSSGVLGVSRSYSEVNYSFISWRPSGATSATRHEQSKRIFLVSRVVAELEFVDVERKVSIAHFMEVADDAALQKRPETFDVLSVNRANDVLACGVVDNRMRVGRRETAISNPLVGDQQRDFFGHGLPDKAFQRRRIDAIDDTSNDLTPAADRADDGCFPRSGSASPAALAALSDMSVLSGNAPVYRRQL